MCGRFTVTTKDTKKIADRFQVELEKALEQGAPAAKESAKAGNGGEGKIATWARPLQRRADPGDPGRPLLAR
jgi:hypothetical protein